MVPTPHTRLCAFFLCGIMAAAAWLFFTNLFADFLGLFLPPEGKQRWPALVWSFSATTPSLHPLLVFVFCVLSPLSSVSARVCVLFVVGLALLQQRKRIVARLTWSLSRPHPLLTSLPHTPAFPSCVCVRVFARVSPRPYKEQRSPEAESKTKKKNEKMTHANRRMRQHTGICREKARRWRRDLLAEAPQRTSRYLDAGSASVTPNECSSRLHSDKAPVPAVMRLFPAFVCERRDEFPNSVVHVTVHVCCDVVSLLAGQLSGCLCARPASSAISRDDQR